jgi:hypothetical protein
MSNAGIAALFWQSLFPLQKNNGSEESMPQNSSMFVNKTFLECTLERKKVVDI